MASADNTHLIVHVSPIPAPFTPLRCIHGNQPTKTPVRSSPSVTPGHLRRLARLKQPLTAGRRLNARSIGRYSLGLRATLSLALRRVKLRLRHCELLLAQLMYSLPPPLWWGCRRLILRRPVARCERTRAPAAADEKAHENQESLHDADPPHHTERLHVLIRELEDDWQEYAKARVKPHV
eukprot:CAMPEP_0181208458 /NCGR_PEP_ID=MMETSP1096-20121128/22130_1 /TAXON_ID=156174 ORGANISM="Chrysochromulina ericina, Strain CCMP281" /NCGR_SAMPLE_ID=MMETSP1096 /ASSEMBLY_ACC=CAM_ASM_000453 /LENGTH=179 /DNA_ID=CAMNT_0023299527 /DNA_START=149 /DNA_END=689 /DNA_ORIENTATION=+